VIGAQDLRFEVGNKSCWGSQLVLRGKGFTSLRAKVIVLLLLLVLVLVLCHPQATTLSFLGNILQMRWTVGRDWVTTWPS